MREICGPWGLAVTPLSEPANMACWSRDERLSAQNKKRNGEMGSPCLKPLVGVMWPWGLPFNLIEYVTEITHCIMKVIHLESKSIFCIISQRHPHSILSKVLLMSSFKTISPILPLLFWFRWCIVSKATKTLSVLRQEDTKALWCSLIILGKKHFSLFVITLEANLERTLLKLMGLYYVIFVGIFYFRDKDNISFFKF